MTHQPPKEGELMLYGTANDTMRVEVFCESETFWLDQKRTAELFGVDVRTISCNMNEIYSSGELTPGSTIQEFGRVHREGSRDLRREIDLNSLDAIISVGYRVNGAQATQFRIWATQTLRESIVTNAGKVSAEVAKRLAEAQYDKFRVRQDREFESDFEAEVKRIESKRTRGRKEAP